MKNNLMLKTISILLTVSLLVFNSCSSYIALKKEPENLRKQLNKNQSIRVHLKDGGIIETKIIEIKENEILGQNCRIKFQEISKIEKIKINPIKSILMPIAVTTGIIFTFIFVAMILNPIDGSPGG